MEKTVKEMMEDIWNSTGGCFRPLYPCSWKLSFFGDFILIKDPIIGEYYAED